MQEHNDRSIGHFAITGPDLSELSAFYRGVIGWGIDEKGPC